MDRIGQVLVETYRVERLVAEGGMAFVFEASHLRIPKRFAVKFLKMSFVSNAEALLRFRREAEIIATLEHPNIVNLIDYNVSDDGAPYIVMEFLDGEHLGKRLEARGKLPLSETLRIGAAVASALSVAHARGIVHRDLKPENILLCKGDQVKVVDFGVAKLRDGPELTAFNTILGTVAYMAPEQITAKPVDARTDQYTLATILHQLCGGTRPPDGATVAEQAMSILHTQPPRLAELTPAVNEVLLRALAKSPDERYPTVSEFMDSLVQAAGPTPTLMIDELPPLAGDATVVTTAPADPTIATTGAFADTSRMPVAPLVTASLELTPSRGTPTGASHAIGTSYPLWVWFALGLAASGSVLTAVWLLAQHR